VIEIDHAIRTGILTQFCTSAFIGINNNGTIFSLKDGFAVAGFDARSIITVLTNMVHIGHLNLGYLTSDDILDPHPELPGVRLGFGNRRPIVTDMFILTGYMTSIAAITSGNINNHYLRHFYFSPFVNTLSNFNPAA
jgi:hypothetical protein